MSGGFVNNSELGVEHNLVLLRVEASRYLWKMGGDESGQGRDDGGAGFGVGWPVDVAGLEGFGVVFGVVD